MASKTFGINVGVDQILQSGDATKVLRANNTEATIATILGYTPLNASGANAALPTSDPAVAGALWNDAGTVKVSAG
jgi:hypothetical protein